MQRQRVVRASAKTALVNVMLDPHVSSSGTRNPTL
jgi:hypothetical protein